MLTQREIDQLKWTKDNKPRVGDNLYLRIRKSSKTYLYRKMVNNKTQFVTLGKHPILKLKEAKRLVSDLESQSITNTTVTELIDKFWNEVVEPVSKVPKQVKGYLDYIDGKIGHKKVIDISKSVLVTIIQKYSTDRGARSADRLRSYLKGIFDYGVELGVIETSPLLGVTKRVAGYRPVDRSRILTAKEIKSLWTWKNAPKGWQNTNENVKVIKFLLLTGLRISEAQKGYVDGDKFRIDDTKGKHGRHETRPHWIYLTPTAKALLPLPKCTATNIQAWLKRKLIKEKIEPRYTPHDCRRTFATIANEQGVMPHIVEKCLNHKLEGMLAVYNHAEYEAERIECAKTVEKYINKVTPKLKLVISQ